MCFVRIPLSPPSGQPFFRRQRGIGWPSRKALYPQAQAAGAHQPAVDDVEHQGGEQEQAAEGGGHAPVDGAVGIEGDEVADHLVVRAAQQRRGDVVADGQDEHQQATGADARDGLWEIHPPEAGERVAAEGNRGAHVARRNALHHAVDRQDHERQHDVHHRDVYAGAVEHQLQRLVDQAELEQRAVDQATRLQQDDPGGDTHQDRGPERQQDQDHQQVALARRQVGQQVGQRVGQQQADDGDHRAHPEGAGEDVQVDGLVRGGARHFAEIVDPVVEGCEQVIGRIAAGVAADHLPVGGVAPALVELLHGVLVGSGLLLERQLARGLRHQAAITGQLHVQALGEIADGLVATSLGEILAERLVDGVGRQRLAVPGGDGLYRQRQRANHFRVGHALVEQRGDRHQEGQDQEGQQGQDQRLGLQAVHPLGARQALLEGAAGGLGYGHSCGHSELRKKSGPSGTTLESVER